MEAAVTECRSSTACPYSKHLLQRSYRQRLLQHEGADGQIWRHILKREHAADDLLTLTFTKRESVLLEQHSAGERSIQVEMLWPQYLGVGDGLEEAESVPEAFGSQTQLLLLLNQDYAGQRNEVF
ncbi:hypothetical protein EYF80_026907 [Liparis tanakae]|uniref:Uncharacterized protein n=1 Tax=Liparis tanakae TaxID=230148 RepID=A0A4Z2HDF8_9TELE|nr:hypothetical protein EYF80_026907 [Liparis tanakae]